MSEVVHVMEIAAGVIGIAFLIGHFALGPVADLINDIRDCKR